MIMTARNELDYTSGNELDYTLNVSWVIYSASVEFYKLKCISHVLLNVFTTRDLHNDFQCWLSTLLLMHRVMNLPCCILDFHRPL